MSLLAVYLVVMPFLIHNLSNISTRTSNATRTSPRGYGR